LTIEEIKEYSGIDSVCVVSDDALKLILPEVRDCTIVVQKDPSDPNYVSLMGAVDDSGETVILLVDEKRVNKAKIDLYFHENDDIVKPNDTWKKNSL